MAEKVGWYRKLVRDPALSGNSLSTEWVPCTVHGFASQVMPQTVAPPTAMAVAIVEEDKTGDVLAVNVQDVRFKNPHDRGKYPMDTKRDQLGLRRPCAVNSNGVHHRCWWHAFFFRDGKPYVLVELENGRVEQFDMMSHDVQFLDPENVQ